MDTRITDWIQKTDVEKLRDVISELGDTSFDFDTETHGIRIERIYTYAVHAGTETTDVYGFFGRDGRMQYVETSTDCGESTDVHEMRDVFHAIQNIVNLHTLETETAETIRRAADRTAAIRADVAAQTENPADMSPCPDCTSDGTSSRWRYEDTFVAAYLHEDGTDTDA